MRISELTTVYYVYVTYVYPYYLEPALVKCTEDTAAALAAFDEYSPLLQSSINPFVFIPKCISYGIFRGDVTATVGTGTFLTNQEKMEITLKELRTIIFHRGIEMFNKILYILRKEPIYVELADHMESKHHIPANTICIEKSVHDVYVHVAIKFVC